ncbi:MAG: hypothetical protein K2X82_18100 [Gemmataceae bacterium]|nr:hypothetical protein [Gemmataceae bacterium]
MAAVVVFCAASDGKPAGLSISFDGKAGAGQTSPTSPAKSKISATGTYDNAGVPAGIKCYYREKDTDAWTVMSMSIDAKMKTWSATVGGLKNNTTYSVQAQIETSTQKKETDIRFATTPP